MTRTMCSCPVPPFTGVVRRESAEGRNQVAEQRQRTNSIKRQRTENTNQRDSNKNQGKTVSGTSISSLTGRKMKSPPADIFIWAVHKDTSKEDIMNDLAASNIKVEVKDIMKKSHEDAPLCSYKISVPAEDLEKALSLTPREPSAKQYFFWNPDARLCEKVKGS